MVMCFWEPGELVVLKTALNVSSSHRRAALNRMLDLKGTVAYLKWLLKNMNYCGDV